jgi:hypothetical protein
MATRRREPAVISTDPSSKGKTGRGSDAAREEMLRRALQRPSPEAPVGAHNDPKNPRPK